MRKKRKIDFVIHENDFEKTIFRFYPRQSTCHSFNDEPPHTWKEVYKVYYYYRIIHRCKGDNFYEVLFDSGCDECSVIDEIAYRIKLISEGHATHIVKNPVIEEEWVINLLDKDVYPFGTGVTWSIQQRNVGYILYLWDWQNKGYKFFLNKDKFKTFGEYLEECCEYMLAHGDPI